MNIVFNVNLRTEIARTIEKLGYKDYELTIVPDGKRVVLD